PLTAWQAVLVACAVPAMNAAAVISGSKRARRVLRSPHAAPRWKFCRGGGMGIFSIIWMIIIGFIVGVLARFFYPGAVNMGFWMTTLLGVGGSLVGGVIGSLIFRSEGGKFHPAGIFLSLIGSLILLYGYLNFVVK